MDCDDAEAHFYFTKVAAGNYLLVAHDGNRVGQRTQIVTVEPGGNVEGADVQLSLGLSLRGSVVASSREAVQGAKIRLTAGGFNPRLVRSAESDAQGTFVLEGLLPAVYRLDASASGFGSFVQEVNLESDPLGLEIVLPSNTLIVGRVLGSTGAPAANASVTVWNSPVALGRDKDRSSRTLLSGEDGAFSAEGLMPGYFWLEAADGKAVAALGPEALAPGEARRVELRFGTGRRISGSAKWKDGGAAANVVVRCKGTLLDRSTRTDEAGNYACDGLTPDLYAVVALRNLADEPWYLNEVDYNIERYGGQRAQLTGEKNLEGIDVLLSRDEKSISGVVLQPDGTPAGNVAVYASREALGASYRATNPRAVDAHVVTFDDGTFQLDNLPDDTYQVRAQGIDGEARQDNVRVGSEVSLQLRASGVLRGVVVGADAEPVRNFTIQAYALAGGRAESYDDVIARSEGPAIAIQTVFDEEGNFEIAGLRAGQYEIVVSTSDRRTGRVATALREGEVRSDLKIQIGKGGSFSGHVIDHATGQPVANCRVDATLAERRLSTVTQMDGSFELSGAAEGQTIRLLVSANGYINDMHTAQKKRDGVVEDLGVIKLVRGRWTESIHPRFADWQTEGRIENTVVVGVRPGSRAEKLGIVPGSIVLRVGATDARNLGPISVSFLGSGPGSSLPPVLRLPDGKVKAYY